MVVGLNAQKQYKEMKNNGASCYKNKQIFPENTMIGALTKYIATTNDKFQPMNANFGILPELEEKIKDKKLRYTEFANRSLKLLKNSGMN